MEKSIVGQQCDLLWHRGPDDSGVLVDRDFGFGMRRLSIVDIAGGHQPMTSANGRFSIVFNGEIYNHLDLRAELTGAGHMFHGHSDTETVLAAFQSWGNDAWLRLEGMYAIAVWDSLTRRLVLARDPLGIKPLYITEQEGGLAFASELKALLILPGHRFDVNERAVHDYFSFGHVRKPRSIYRQVHSLEPGHYLTIGALGEPITERFWHPVFHENGALGDEDWVHAMREQLEGSVQRHMQSDVPVGTFLSGGIDSSAVTAAMARVGGGPIKAFTISYPGASIDEASAAAAVARFTGCEHIVRELSVGDACAVLPLLQNCFDEPFADMAAIPNWYASKVAAEHVKVVLCGEGGDELFAGYKRHRNARLIERLRPLVDAAAPVARMIGRLPPSPSARINRWRQNIHRFGEFSTLPDGYQQFFASTQISSTTVQDRIYSAEFRHRQQSLDRYDWLTGDQAATQAFGDLSDPLAQFLHADLSLNMPSAMLTRLDRTSMAHSLEARVPLLSHKLVDWALAMPMRMKIRGRTGKYVLRKAAAPWLPAEIMRRPKQGFQIPFASWFQGALGTLAYELWQDSGAARSGYLDPVAVDQLFAEHRAGHANHGRMLYAIAMFGSWWSAVHEARPRLRESL